MLERMQRRATVVRAIRAFFDTRGFVEVDTPVAQTALAPEAHIEAPAVTLRAEGGVQRRFLQTSPELCMKRLLATGLERIYQLAPVFRDGDFTRLHRPEFRLLEWYRRGAGWTALMDDCEELLSSCAAAAGRGQRFSYANQPINLARPFRRVSVDAAFRAHAGFSIVEALDVATLRQRLVERDIHFAEDDSWDDLFHRAFLSRVEPALVATHDPFFLTHYPTPLAALARTSPDDARVAERFELYLGGLELANGFGELVDAAEQRRRFVTESERRRRAGMHDYPLDERFLSALALLPPSAGIALGLERLLMVLFDVADIDDVAFIPWSQA